VAGQLRHEFHQRLELARRRNALGEGLDVPTITIYR